MSRRSRGQQVEHAVDDSDVAGGAGQVFQLGTADEAELVAGGPLVAETERQIVVDFLEQDLVAEKIAVQVPRQ